MYVVIHIHIHVYTCRYTYINSIYTVPVHVCLWLYVCRMFLNVQYLTIVKKEKKK